MSPEDKVKDEASFFGNTVIPMVCVVFVVGIILATCSVNVYDPTWKGQNDASRSESNYTTK